MSSAPSGQRPPPEAVAPALLATLATLDERAACLHKTLEVVRLCPIWPRVVALVRAYLPPRAAAGVLTTLRRDPHRGVVAFRDGFAAWYFPLSVEYRSHWDATAFFAGLPTARLELHSQAFEWEGTEPDAGLREGILLVWSLVGDRFDELFVDPFAEDDEDPQLAGYEAGPRAPETPSGERVRAECAAAGGDEVARLLAALPKEGLPRDALHARLDGTPYEGAAWCADWMARGTGLRLLDFDADDLYFASFGDATEEDRGLVVPFEPLAILKATAEWQQVRRVLDCIVDFVDWVEEDFPARAEAVLRAALGPPSGRPSLLRDLPVLAPTCTCACHPDAAQPSAS